MLKKKFSLIVILSAVFCTFLMNSCKTPAERAEQQWVDSVYNSLNDVQRVAQLFMVRTNFPIEDYLPDVERWIKDYNVGGVLLFQPKDSSLTALVSQINTWQADAQTPLLVAIDGESGVAWRLKHDSIPMFPYQLTLGAVSDDSLIYQMGVCVAEQCQRLGFSCNFAPVVDVNNNANNPVIGTRSFGSNPEKVAHKGAQYALGMQSKGLITTMKHFPGHGNTDTDSHLSLPVIKHAKTEVDTVELVPFRHLINQGVNGCMIGHLYFEALEKTPGLSSSLSHSIVTDLLKKELGFKGLVVTDGLDMQGIMQGASADSIPLFALMAGNDVLLIPSEVDAAIKVIVDAAAHDRKVRKMVKSSCKKILHYKYRAGLKNPSPISTENVESDMNKAEYHQLIQKLYDEALTLLKNENNVLPLRENQNRKIACLSIGNGSEVAVSEKLNALAVANSSFNLKKDTMDAKEVARLMKQLSKYDLVLVNIQATDQRLSANKNYAITDGEIAFVDSLAKLNNVVLNLFACPYALDRFDLSNLKAVVVACEDNAKTQDAVARLLAGKLSPKGHLPVAINAYSEGFSMAY